MSAVAAVDGQALVARPWLVSHSSSTPRPWGSADGCEDVLGDVVADVGATRRGTRGAGMASVSEPGLDPLGVADRGQAQPVVRRRCIGCGASVRSSRSGRVGPGTSRSR